MDVEDKKLISEAISDGLEEGFWKPLVRVLFGVIVVVVISFLGMYGLMQYDTTPIVLSGSVEPAGTIHCYVYGGNETHVEQITDFKIIGYNEANAKYKQLKPKINIWLKERNHSLSYMDCN